MSASSPLVIPVEKKGRFSETYALRFLCFDPKTRMAYLSDKGTKVRFWKHQMKLYALVPRLFEHKDSNGILTSVGSVALDFRKENFEANDLLTFVMHGVSHHKLDPDNAADRQVMNRLPNLLQVTFEDAGSTAAVSTRAVDGSDHGKLSGGHYREGDGVGHHSDTPVSMEDDSGFFGRDRTSWQLRCPYFNLWQDVMNMMRDALIADGLRVPIHGNFPRYCDPRNGLPLTTIPLWLAKPFHLLTNAVVYSCIHGRMVGCSPQGAIGICMRHCYVCITDQDVLFMSESGQAVRWLPVKKVERFEYNIELGKGSTTESASEQPYCSFVARDGLADVVFMPCNAFTKSTASASMVSTMPQCNPAQEIKNIAFILEKLSQGLPNNAGATAEEADADIDLGEVGGEDDSFDPDLQVPEEGPAPTASTRSGFTAAQVAPTTMTVEQYCEQFPSTHGRAFNWQPIVGARQETPSVLQAHVLARRLMIPQPERQPVTLRAEFSHFYFPDGDPTALTRGPSPSSSSSSGAGNRSGGRGGTAATGGPQASSSGVDELYVAHVPVKRASKLANVMGADRRLFIA